RNVTGVQTCALPISSHLGAGVTGGPFIDAMYPRVLVETGLLGSCAFLVLLWAVFRTGVTGYQQVPDPFMRGVTLGFLLGFGGLRSEERRVGHGWGCG